MKKIVSIFILLLLIVSFSYGVSAQSTDQTAQAEKQRQAILRDILMNLFKRKIRNITMRLWERMIF